MIHAVTDGTSYLGNEDRFGYSGGAAWVLDGATDISGIKLEGRTAAWWLVEAYQAELQNCAGHGAAEEPFDLVTRVALGARHRLHTRFGTASPAIATALEQASTALSLVRRVNGSWNVISFADCPVLYRDPVTGQVNIVFNEGFTPVERRSLEALKEAQLREPNASLARLSELTRPVLKENRAMMNTEKGYAIGAIQPPPRALVHQYRLPEGVEAFVILSDGFSRWYDVFGLGSPEELFQRTAAGEASQVLAELRAAERDDPEGRRYPRFKTHDDATCLYAKVDAL